MHLGYGAIRGKPYVKGGRGGVAWSGGRTLRYDPTPRRGGWRGRAKGIAGKALNFFEKYATGLGALIGFIVPAELCRAKHGSPSLYEHYVKGTIHEVQSLFNGGWWHDTGKYLEYKFLSPDSSWSIPFWGSLVTYVGTHFAKKAIGGKLGRGIGIINKLSLGTLISATIGALISLGGSKEARLMGQIPPNNYLNGRGTNNNRAALSYTMGKN